MAAAACRADALAIEHGWRSRRKQAAASSQSEAADGALRSPRPHSTHSLEDSREGQNDNKLVSVAAAEAEIRKEGEGGRERAR